MPFAQPNPRPISPVLLALLLTLGAGASLPAQSAADRAELEWLRSALSSARSPGELAGIGQPARATDGALNRIRQGLVQLRLGELTGDRARLDEAIMRFDQAQLARPRWPYPWFGLALAKQRLHRLDALVKSSRTQLDGVSHFEGYTQAFAEVLRRDSLFLPAIEQLRATLLEQGDREQPRKLMDPIRRFGLGPAGTAEDALILARDFRRRDRADSTLLSLELYLERGGDSGIAALERAHTLATFGSPVEARASYLDGLAHLSPAARLAYRLDLRWIATAEELSGFDRVPDDSVAGWVADFWHWRDVEEMRQEGERLKEHLRRWGYIDTHFRVDNPERRTVFSRVWVNPAGACNRGDYYAADDILGDSIVRPADGRHRERLYDDRAYVYMRHGEPARRLKGITVFQDTFSAPSSSARDEPASSGRLIADDLLDERRERARSNESWLYWFGGSRRIFHFEGSNMLGLAGPTTLVVEPLDDPVWLESRGELDPLYTRVAHAMGKTPVPFPCLRLVQEVAANTRKDAGVGLRTDSYTLLFKHEITPVVQMYAMGRPDLGNTRILVVFAIPGDQLIGQRPDAIPGVAYEVVTRLGATDSTRRIARSLDTVRTFLAPDSLRKGTHLTGYLELPVPAGDYRVGSAFLQPSSDLGGSVIREGLTLTPSTNVLYLSDVITGREGSGLTWQYRGEAVPLNPLGAFSPKDAAELFYEASGLTPGRSYITSIELAPLKAHDDKETVRLRFSAIAEDSEMRVRRTLGLARLSKGQYRLTVEVTEEGSSRRVRREQYLTILE